MHRVPTLQREKKQTVTPTPRSLDSSRPGRDSLGTSPSRWPWLIGGITLAADQLSKLLLASSFTPGHSVPLLSPVLSLTYVQNTGAAFGLFKGQQWLFILISLGVMAWIVWELRAHHPVNRLVGWACGLLLGGAAGNLIDRVRLGYVIDFLDLHWWPVFNIGDSAITIGVTLLILHSLWGAPRHSPRAPS